MRACIYINSVCGIYSFHIARCVQGKIQSTRLLSQCVLHPKTKDWKSCQEVLKKIWSRFLLSNWKLKPNMLKLDFFATESCSAFVNASTSSRVLQNIPQLRMWTCRWECCSDCALTLLTTDALTCLKDFPGKSLVPTPTEDVSLRHCNTNPTWAWDSPR